MTYNDVLYHDVSLSFANEARVSVQKALKLRKEINKLEESIKTIREARDHYIRTHSKDGQTIEHGTKEFNDFMEEMKTETELPEVTPVLSINDFESSGISVRAIESLVALGLMNDPEQ